MSPSSCSPESLVHTHQTPWRHISENCNKYNVHFIVSLIPVPIMECPGGCRLFMLYSIRAQRYDKINTVCNKWAYSLKARISFKFQEMSGDYSFIMA